VTLGKRIFDILLALWLVIWLGPIILYIAILILVKEGRPVFYKSERMSTPDKSFMLWKFRTMRTTDGDAGVSGGDKHNRITPLGKKLRRLRLDEFPQLWNILKGDLSFIGPRPPLKEYTDRFPELYEEVLKSRPGVSGMASLYMHGYEERLLANCNSRDETDATYTRRCIPLKAKLDLLYQSHQSVCLDIWLIWQTMKRVFGKK